MFDDFFGALIIVAMRICDVSIGTIRTILIVQGKKYLAGAAGFFEVLIWVFAIRIIFQHLDNYANLLGYASGFGLGTILGIAIEHKIGLGHIQLNIISKNFANEIAIKLRKLMYGVTVLPGEGGTGRVSVIVVITARKYQKKIINIIEAVDKDAFITVQYSVPFRGFIRGVRK